MTCFWKHLFPPEGSIKHEPLLLLLTHRHTHTHTYVHRHCSPRLHHEAFPNASHRDLLPDTLVCQADWALHWKELDFLCFLDPGDWYVIVRVSRTKCRESITGTSPLCACFLICPTSMMLIAASLVCGTESPRVGAMCLTDCNQLVNLDIILINNMVLHT